MNELDLSPESAERMASRLEHRAPLYADRDRAAALLRALAKEVGKVAFVGALEELEHWPDLANVRFAVRHGDSVYEVPPDQVTGIFEALASHVDAMVPWARSIVDQYREVESLRDQRTGLINELIMLRDRFAKIPNCEACKGVGTGGTRHDFATGECSDCRGSGKVIRV